mmetsp:Transcript_18384/g.43962  ORF Transcript_18384/g.43962 Transcript_18384/m.43962 type:complete len:240 (+) Transcript_18384:1134-1853(+)
MARKRSASQPSAGAGCLRGSMTLRAAGARTGWRTATCSWRASAAGGPSSSGSLTVTAGRRRPRIWRSVWRQSCLRPCSSDRRIRPWLGPLQSLTSPLHGSRMRRGVRRSPAWAPTPQGFAHTFRAAQPWRPSFSPGRSASPTLATAGRSSAGPERLCRSPVTTRLQTTRSASALRLPEVVSPGRLMGGGSGPRPFRCPAALATTTSATRGSPQSPRSQTCKSLMQMSSSSLQATGSLTF